MTKPKMSYFKHIRRKQGSLEKTIILEEKNRRQQEERRASYERE